jgi:hypothetical protein
MMSNQKPEAIRQWQAPYDVLMAFASATTAEEVERIRPRIRGAMRDLNRRAWKLKRHFPPKPKWVDIGPAAKLDVNKRLGTPFRLPELVFALGALLHATRSNTLIDQATAQQIVGGVERIMEYRD